VFTEITLEFTVLGDGVKKEEVEKALKISEEKICPVWAMLKASTSITATYKIMAETTV
jgi:putative redox protein